MARTYKRKDRRGREVFYIDYTVLGVRKRERVGYDKRQAEDALESRKTDIRRRKFDGILPDPTCRLEEIWKRYLPHSRTTKSAKQVDREINIYNKHLIPAFGSTPLNKITKEQVEAYQARRRDEGIAPATVNKELQLLKNVTKKALEWGRIRTNQIATVRPLKTPQGRVRYLGAGRGSVFAGGVSRLAQADCTDGYEHGHAALRDSRTEAVQRRPC